MSSLYFHKLTRKIKENERQKNLMVDGYVLNKVLEKIEEVIRTDTKILIDTNNKLPDDITLKKCCDVNDRCYKKRW